MRNAAAKNPANRNIYAIPRGFPGMKDGTAFSNKQRSDLTFPSPSLLPTHRSSADPRLIIESNYVYLHHEPCGERTHTRFRLVSDDESGEKTVSVLLAGEESELTFIDHSCAEMTVSERLFYQNRPSTMCYVTRAEQTRLSLLSRLSLTLGASRETSRSPARLATKSLSPAER